LSVKNFEWELVVRVNQVEIKLDKEEEKEEAGGKQKDLNSQREWHFFFV